MRPDGVLRSMGRSRGEGALGRRMTRMRVWRFITPPHGSRFLGHALITGT
ncbi:hypothetical protein STRTUCAR8_03846 [Streptomyces turgidiscabies Car8]|uniref:Uncharacterized protein n=1 Tax=Streptomyces turgidiscabies (strain Car8) TaxID=698760 RepID=L7FC35_STRT8|nr:hypothetical protein STRTUCAR8_03846 [Streptomyces turgidiscabies Car8]